MLMWFTAAASDAHVYKDYQNSVVFSILLCSSVVGRWAVGKPLSSHW